MRITFICWLLLTSLLAFIRATSTVLLKLKDETKSSLDDKNADADPKLVRALLDNNFESGSLNPWYDESPGYVNWRAENFTTPSERNSTVPQPITGTQYVRATRNADLASGLAVLRSPTFTASPGDRFSFDFWIRSKRPEGNNLELVWLVDRTEQLLLTLSQFSTSSNYEWRTTSAVIPVDVPTDGVLVFYGYCASNNEDAIAIDNILIESSAYTTQAPGTDCVILNATYGTFASPNYPSNYPDNANVCWLINDSSSITLQFNTFETETGRDTLKIYLGQTTSSQLYADLTGTYLPSTITEYSDSMLLVFTSDSKNNYAGFSITYQIIRSPVTTPTVTSSIRPTSSNGPIICESGTSDSTYGSTYTSSVTSWSTPEYSSCGGVFSGYSGTIESLNYPYAYENGLNCHYLIQVPCGFRVRLRFNSFNTESGYDFVNITDFFYVTDDDSKVYDGPSTSNYLIIRASGNSIPSTIYSSTNAIFLQFTTDIYGTRSGWQAEFQYFSYNLTIVTVNQE